MAQIYTEVQANQGIWNWFKHIITGNNYYTTESGVTVKTASDEGSVKVDDKGYVYVDGMEDVSIFGSNHDDAIFVSNSNVKKIEGKNGNDYIEVLDCENVENIYGGNGNDTIVSWNSHVKRMEGQNGKDKMVVSGGSVGYIHGGRDDDELYSQRGAEIGTMDGYKGNDKFSINRSTVSKVIGFWGNDTIEVKDSTVQDIAGGSDKDTFKLERSKVGNLEGEDGFWGFYTNLFANDNVYSLDSEIGGYARVNVRKQSTSRKAS